MIKFKLLLRLNLIFFGGGTGGGGGFRGGRHLGRRQKKNTPMNNQEQNKQFKAVVKELGLDKGQKRQLHDEISGQGFGYREILDTARDMFGLN